MSTMPAKIHLPDVTLLCADCYIWDRVVVAMERSLAQCSFGAVKFLTSLDMPYRRSVVKIPPINSINEYSAFCLKEMYKYVDTSHALLVQHDGYVLRGESWDPSWLQRDYIGPLYDQDTIITPASVGSGGFSLRSRRLMQLTSELLPPWDGQASYDSIGPREWAHPTQRTNFWGHEDGIICFHLRQALMNRGISFGTPQEAARFAHGKNKVMRDPQSFGFHGYCPGQIERGITHESMDAAMDAVRRYYSVPRDVDMTAADLPPL
jgi:hypothetical protein